MRILALLKANRESEAGTPPPKEMMDAMGPFLEEITKAGVLLATDGLTPSSKGKRVNVSGTKTKVTDGPFTESKELVASYALLKVKSMDEGVEWCTRFLKVLGGGECELRPIMEAADFPPEVATHEVIENDKKLRAQMQKNAAGK